MNWMDRVTEDLNRGNASKWYRRKQKGYKLHTAVLDRCFKTVRVHADLLYKMQTARKKLGI